MSVPIFIAYQTFKLYNAVSAWIFIRRWLTIGLRVMASGREDGLGGAVLEYL